MSWLDSPHRLGVLLVITSVILAALITATGYVLDKQGEATRRVNRAAKIRRTQKRTK